MRRLMLRQAQHEGVYGFDAPSIHLILSLSKDEVGALQARVTRGLEHPVYDQPMLRTPLENKISIHFIWIPQDLGGHSAAPWPGMRLTIRWQRYIEDYLKIARDTECQLESFDPATGRGTATCLFRSDIPLPEDWLRDGELIELLSGFRVLAVGRIVGKTTE